MINDEVNQTIADLRSAIAYLKTVDWIQGRDFDGSTGCCAFGAIRHVIGDDESGSGRFDGSSSTRDRAANAARAFYRIFGKDVTTYNDAQGRTKEQVIRALETVVDSLERDPNRA